jgi:hypothetical protein
MSTPKFRIYKGVVCLEAPSTEGRKWWDQGYGLGYTPYPIDRIYRMRHGFAREGGREILAVDVEGQWVALNPPRSDVPTLVECNLWPQTMPRPFEEVQAYTPWPENCDLLLK